MTADSTVDALVTQLKAQGWRCACAESCTGGGLGERLTRPAGSSAWFDCAVVTYSNASKLALLGVSEAALTAYGAVSPQVAEAMAVGLLRRCAAQTTAAITGIAGPEGGSETKPVGTVVFAWAAIEHEPVHVTQHFRGDRAQVRDQAVEFALSGWAEFLHSRIK